MNIRPRGDYRKPTSCGVPVGPCRTCRLSRDRSRNPPFRNRWHDPAMDASHVADDLETVLLTEEQIHARVATLAAELHDAYGDREPVLVGVLGGAATFTVDLARAYPGQVEIGWMAVKSYSTRNRASGLVRLLKDLDIDITGRDVVIVDGVIDTGLTMSWIIANLVQRAPRSIA